MKRFFKYIILRIGVLIVILFLLDVLFTAIYVGKKGVRNKIEYVFQNKEQHFDYIFLGSSRVEHHIDTDFMNKKLQTISLNLGISGQNLTETFLLLKLLIDKGFNAEKYFIQLDESDLNAFKNKSVIGASYFMPYLKNDNVKNHFKKYDEDFVLNSKIPFYRYMNYGYKIGYRELLLKMSNKTRKGNFFIGLNTTLKNKNESYVFKEKYQNDLLSEIKTFAKEKKLELVFFTSPYYHPKRVKNYKDFAKANNIVHYIDSIKEVKYFKDSDHLNADGARLFTKKIIRDFNLMK